MSIRPFPAFRCSGLCLVLALFACLPEMARAQADAKPQVQTIQAEGRPSGGPARTRGPRPSPNGEQPKPEGAKPDESPKGEDKPGAKKEDTKPGQSPMGGNQGPIQRKDEPGQPSDPAELKVRPDDRGMVRFNFRGQAWPDVLDWLADISNTSLDWQELPGDYLNLTTQRAYSVDEVRDLLNERLMTRGYTILQQREGFVVAKLEGLNPARVPRVHSEDLRHRDAHEFVKVSFPLSWLMAEDAVEELKPMLSKHGSMSALATSNRLEVLDVVSNLREIQHVLREEQSSEVRSSKVHEFFLRYTRAEDVMTQLQSLLGIQKSSGGGMSAMNPQMMQQMQQMQQQMMQQMQRQQQGGNNNARRRSNTPDDIHLVINSRQNSIIANAPPDKIVVIAEAVKMFDVPPQPGATIGANFQRVKVFRLAQLDPKALQAMLLQAGNLDPSTQLVADDKNKALIAYATPADQMTIEALISKLDGTGRQFKVIRLRRLQADYVAGSIQFMMGSEEEEDNSNSRRGYYSYYGYGRQQEDTQSKDKFRVDADVVNNRLLLWANEVELEAVENLLVQLGEIPSGGDSQRGRLRTLDLGTHQSAQDLVKKLKEVWPQVSPSPLKVEVAEPKKQPEPEPTKPKETEEKKPDSDSSVTYQQAITVPVHLAVATQADGADEDEPQAADAVDDNQLEGLSQDELMQKYFPQASPESQAAKSAADQPVVIQVDENGRMTLASENPAVLDLLEDILLEMTPPAKEYEVFKLKHAPALYVSWNLEDFFEEEEEDDTNSRTPWFWDYNQQDQKEDPRRLSQRAPIKFLSDTDTNTILVQNATAEQLVTIRELIELYDKPEPVVEANKRLNATYAVRYSKATAIAESVKEVFRDLLSSNDKSLQAPQQQGGDRERGEERSASDLITRSGSAFRGKLSIGVDDISNTLLISTEGESLMKLVMDMVKRIDESAQQVSTVRVVNLKTGVGGDKFRELLNRLLEKVDPQQAQQQQMQNQNGQPGGPQPNQNGQRGPRNWQQNRGQPQAIQVDN